MQDRRITSKNRRTVNSPTFTGDYDDGALNENYYYQTSYFIPISIPRDFDYSLKSRNIIAKRDTRVRAYTGEISKVSSDLTTLN